MFVVTGGRQTHCSVLKISAVCTILSDNHHSGKNSTTEIRKTAAQLEGLAKCHLDLPAKTTASCRLKQHAAKHLAPPTGRTCGHTW